MNIRGCNTNLKSDINSFNILNAVSGDIPSLVHKAEDIHNKNNIELCGLW